jgi:hypothetical protein
LHRLLARIRANPRLSLVVLLLAGAGAWIALRALHPGDTRRIVDVLGQVRDAVIDGDTEAALRHVSPRFSTDGLVRQDLKQSLDGMPLDLLPRRVSLYIAEKDIKEREALVEVVVRSTGSRGRITSEWTVQLEKLKERWLIVSARPQSVNRRPSTGLAPLLRRARWRAD